MPPRAVVVTRPTALETLLELHGTLGQVRFFLETRGQDVEDVSDHHRRFECAKHQVMTTIPREWRRASVTRPDLERFLFEPEDIVVVLGPDGLVANAAKYLDGQLVIGLNPDPASYDGVLVSHRVEQLPALLLESVSSSSTVEERAIVEASIDSRERLRAVNEIFVGHRSHQSAVYELSWRGEKERQISSGLIVSTGTGSTGWARSINQSRPGPLVLPEAMDKQLSFFVREAFPSISSSTSLTAGLLEDGETLEIVSRMDDGGVVFGDGIETDRLNFTWGRRLTVALSSKRLRLLVS